MEDKVTILKPADATLQPMTFQSPVTDFAGATPVADNFAITRSSWMDEFAAFEAAVCECLIRFNAEVDRRAPLSQRLKTLTDLKASPTLSKKNLGNLTKMASTCELLLAIRASIVHSVMTRGERDGKPVALFHNALDAARDLPIYLIMTHRDFETSRNELKRRAGILKACLNPS